MATQNTETREKVRELVRQILKTVPTEDESPASAYPERVVVNSLKEKVLTEFDRDESAKSLITEDDLRGLDAGARVRIAQNTRLTPLAQDIVNEKGIELVRKARRNNEIRARSVAIGSDHGGFPVKERLKGFLVGLGLSVKDLGTNSTDA